MAYARYVAFGVLMSLAVAGCGDNSLAEQPGPTLPDSIAVVVSGPTEWQEEFALPSSRARYKVSFQTDLAEDQLYWFHRYALDADGQVNSQGHGTVHPTQGEGVLVQRQSAFFITAWGPHQYVMSLPHVMELKPDITRPATETVELALVPATRLWASLANSNPYEYVHYSISLDDGRMLYQTAVHKTAAQIPLIVPAGQKLTFMRLNEATYTEIGPFEAKADVYVVLDPGREREN
ncbi:MAG: hypothetical protein H6839_01755 [Planctomycetes bacterium]|nr:hypothetical protein [Planctomycetota bacterium]